MSEENGATENGAPLEPRIIGRYALFDEIAAGGMATVHVGRLLGPVGFARTVAIKRLHPQFAKDPEFVSMFLDEARLAARIRHPNVVPTLDVVALKQELFLVMEFVQGESLGRLLRALRRNEATPPVRIITTIMAGVLHGLHAAHEAKTERGEQLQIVHRDVSPQNVLVGTDGVARVLDFGVAKAARRAQHTRDGQVKGKIAYMAPEQLMGEAVDRRSDIYAAAVVLWEGLVGQRLFEAENEGLLISKILNPSIPTPSSFNHGVPKALDEIVLRGLSPDLSIRFQSAKDFAIALERSMPLAPASEIGAWVEATSGGELSQRLSRLGEIENISDVMDLQSRRSPSSPPSQRMSIAGPTPPPTTPASTDSGTPGYVVPPSVSKKTWLVWIAAVPILLLAVIGLVSLSAGKKPRDSSPTPSAPAQTGSLANAVTAPSASSMPSAIATMSASSTPVALDLDTPKPKPSSTPATTTKATTKPTPKPEQKCNPPFYVGTDGIKHIKPGCG